MKNNEHINQEVSKTLASLDEISKAEANPYLYSKITERLAVQYNAIPARIKWLSLGLAASLALAVTIMLTTPAQEQSAEEAFAQEYSLSVNSYTF